MGVKIHNWLRDSKVRSGRRRREKNGRNIGAPAGLDVHPVVSLSNAPGCVDDAEREKNKEAESEEAFVRNRRALRPTPVWAVLVLLGGCGHSDSLPPAMPPAVDIVTIGDQVDTFCGDCHATPLPEHFPKDRWLELVSNGYQFYTDSGRSDLVEPALHEVVEFYRRQAPPYFATPVFPAVAQSSPIQFESRDVDIGRPPRPPFAVAFMTWFAARSDDERQLVFGDMMQGGLYVTDLSATPATEVTLKSPAHIQPCDLDGDGLRDLLVADLGGYQAEDHLRGRVVWIHRNGSDWDAPRVLAANIGRVADARAGDFDADGDQDVVVAEFGWRKTGGLFLLLNQGGQGSDPQFIRQDLDGRHGAIHVPPIDLDADGRLDFIALISQEHETIEAFINVGHEFNPPQVQFERRILFEANNPAYGCSGIDLADLDQDGDVDLVLTNGDVLDTTMVRPYQGISWLENCGDFPFVHHWITAMPGVQRALTKDLDGDGDLDIAAVALLPEGLVTESEFRSLDSVIWLEQTAPGEFQRRAVETGASWHAALEISDVDQDGAADLLVGNFLLDRLEVPQPWLQIWKNVRQPPHATTANRVAIQD